MPHANILRRTRHKLAHNALTERYAAIKAYFAAINAELLAAAYAEGRAEARAELIQELIDRAPPDAPPEYLELLEQFARNQPAKPRPRP